MSIEKKLDLIILEINQIKLELKESTDKMNKHIDFVEYTYGLVQKPFFTLMNMIPSFSFFNNPIHDEISIPKKCISSSL